MYPDYLVGDCDPKLHRCVNDEEEPKVESIDEVESEDNTESEDNIESEDKPESEDNTESEDKPESEDKIESEDKPESEDNTESEDNPESDCQDKATNGQSYKGKENKAKNGEACQPWDTVDRAKDWGLSGNWCRNPDNETGEGGGVWCYLEPRDGAVTWEHCAVPWC